MAEADKHRSETTLSVVGSTKTGSMLDPKDFNTHLKSAKTVGESLLSWWNSSTVYPTRGTGEFISWHYGLSIIGDPLVRLIPEVDLYMKDDLGDTGATPNNIDNPDYTFRESDDIWIRNKRDNIEQHQNPVYREGKPVYVYARIRNRGVKKSLPGQVMIHWSHAGISLDYDSFLGNIEKEGLKTGGRITETPIYVPPINPGESVVVSVPWFIRNPKEYSRLTDDKNWHYCMLAEVESVEDPIYSRDEKHLKHFVTKNNNIVMKNIYNIEVSDNDYNFIDGVISIRNPYAKEHNFSLIIQESSNSGRSMADLAKVSLELSPNVQKAMMQSGVSLYSLKSLPAERRLVLNADKASVEQLRLPANDLGVINVKFNFDVEHAQEKGTYEYRVILKDEQTGEVLGGETYRVTKRPRPMFEAKAEVIPGASGYHFVAKEINEPAGYQWRDNEGRLIGEGLELRHKSADDITLEVEALRDGVRGNTTVKAPNTASLFKVYPNPANTYLETRYSIGEEGSLTITSLNQGNSLVYRLSPNETTKRLEIGSLPRGEYLVSLIVGGEVLGEQIVEVK